MKSLIPPQLEAEPDRVHVQLQNCCIQGWSNTLGGQGNFGDDPLFANLAGPDQILGRTRRNKVVAFEGPPEWVGSYHQVRLTGTTGATFVGELATASESTVSS